VGRAAWILEPADPAGTSPNPDSHETIGRQGLLNRLRRGTKDRNNAERATPGDSAVRLDLTSLKLAIASLGRGIARSKTAPEDEELRDAVIQRFEYTYDLCWRMLKRRIELDAAVPSAVDAMSFRELMRDAGERGLVDDVARWFVYREQRNVTSHIYDSRKAAEVYATALEFLADAQSLLDRLAERNP